MKHLKLLGMCMVIAVLYSSCSVNKSATKSGLIQDCPQEKIVYKKVIPGAKAANEYYMYKGKRHEISEFDENWIKKNCQVRLTIFY